MQATDWIKMRTRDGAHIGQAATQCDQSVIAGIGNAGNPLSIGALLLRYCSSGREVGGSLTPMRLAAQRS